MKNYLRTMLPAVLLMTFLSGSALAQPKIATVDLNKLFNNFWKTKEASAAIQRRAAELDKDDQDYKQKFKQGTDDYQKLLAQANDPALSAEAREKQQKAADEKLKSLQESKTVIDQFERQAQATLNDQRKQAWQKVLVEIQAKVTAKAKAGGYTLVIDQSAPSINQAPIVLYAAPENDLTDAVLAQLNVGAPIDVSTPAAMPSTPSLLENKQP